MTATDVSAITKTLLLTDRLDAGMTDAFVTITRTEGPAALYKGLAPTLVGIAPYAALNFALYDLVKQTYYGGQKVQNPWLNLALGGMTGTVAATICYPLDTVRRRMQMKGTEYKSQVHAMTTIFAKVSSAFVFADVYMRSKPFFPII